MSRPYLQHAGRHTPRVGSDPSLYLGNEWCLARAAGSVPGDNSSTIFDLELAFGSGVDSGLFTQNTGGTFDVVQINDIGTFKVQWTANWSGAISSPSDGQALLANAVTSTGIQTSSFGFGGLPVDGREILRASGTDYSDRLSAGGFLHWPTDENTPPAFETSGIGMTCNQNTGSSLTLIFEVYIERVDLYMLSEADALAWTP